MTEIVTHIPETGPPATPEQITEQYRQWQEMSHNLLLAEWTIKGATISLQRDHSRPILRVQNIFRTDRGPQTAKEFAIMPPSGAHAMDLAVVHVGHAYNDENTFKDMDVRLFGLSANAAGSYFSHYVMRNIRLGVPHEVSWRERWTDSVNPGLPLKEANIERLQKLYTEARSLVEVVPRRKRAALLREMGGSALRQLPRQRPA